VPTWTLVEGSAQVNDVRQDENMFTLQHAGLLHRKPRLVAPAGLDTSDFHKIAETLHVTPIKARKVGLIAAKQLSDPRRIETRWNGKESEIDAEPGDWMVTSLSPEGVVLRDADGHTNTYAIKPEKFAEVYDLSTETTEFGAIFRPKGVVEAVHLSGGFEIMAPWGEQQRADDGYILLNGNDVYGNHRETFEATYEAVA
jgi:hypothetical protein